QLVRGLLAVRRRELAPRLRGSGQGRFETLGTHAVALGWELGDGSTLALVANLGVRPVPGAMPPGRTLWSSSPAVPRRLAGGALPGFAVAAFLDAPPER